MLLAMAGLAAIIVAATLLEDGDLVALGLGDDPSPDGQPVGRLEVRALASQQDDVIFLGRLGTYRYYNMDQVVGQALATYRRLAERMTAQAGAASTAAE